VIQKTGSLPKIKISLRIKKILRALIFRKNTLGMVVDYEKSTVLSDKTIAIKRIDKLFGLIKLKLQQLLIIKKLNTLPNYIGLIAGYKSLDRFTRRSDPIIWIGSNDYHTFNKVKKELVLNRSHQAVEPFILFIDDNLPGAHDWTLLGISAPVTEALYYPALNTFFEKIESIYDMPVRIAAHPSDADEDYVRKMGVRHVIYGNTAMLTLQSSLVLMHASTAVSFAVMARKPIIFLTTQELDQSHYGLNVMTMSESLGSPLVFMDVNNTKEIELKKIFIDECKYSLYEANYLHNEHSNEIEPWGALIGFINTSPQMAEHA
jgi:hypothetical protein